MPRCYTTKKYIAQQQHNRQNVITTTTTTPTTNVSNNNNISKTKASIVTTTATTRQNNSKRQNNSRSGSGSGGGGGGEWKMPTMANTHQKFSHRTSSVVAQHKSKDDPPGPVSPTEGSVAPIYYNNTHETNSDYLTPIEMKMNQQATVKSNRQPTHPLSIEKVIFYACSQAPSKSTTTELCPTNENYEQKSIYNVHDQQDPIFRDRSIEETEAAHDLLSLSQSLPPLPAPCVVTILHHDSSFNPNSPIVPEMCTGGYSTFNNTTTNNNNFDSKKHTNIIEYKSEKHMDNEHQYHERQLEHRRNNVSPLTPPASESSSDAEHSSYSESSNSEQPLKRKSKTNTMRNGGTTSSDDTKTTDSDSKVYAMTIFDSVMINDGRTKKGSGEAEIIHVEDKRPGRYRCPECGKQYATSSNLSRHKQTHRSLDSQSAKKCHTCGKAYVSMPALAMHLLTHKLTHSCGVCGKLFSRPWLLQGHLRSHTGEKPYGCAHCGKAFADRSNLRAHMQTHSIVKHYECTRCRKSFALKSYLNKHLESACLRDEFKKFDGTDMLSIDDEDDYDEDEDIIVA